MWLVTSLQMGNGTPNEEKKKRYVRTFCNRESLQEINKMVLVHNGRVSAVRDNEDTTYTEHEPFFIFIFPFWLGRLISGTLWYP